MAIKPAAFYATNPSSPPLPLPFPKLRSSCSPQRGPRAATLQFGEGKGEGRGGWICRIECCRLDCHLQAKALCMDMPYCMCSSLAARLPSPAELGVSEGSSNLQNRYLCCSFKTVWPSGLRRWLKAPFRKGVGSNPTAVISLMYSSCQASLKLQNSHG